MGCCISLWNLECCTLYNRPFLSDVPERTDICDRRMKLSFYIIGFLITFGISIFYIVTFMTSKQIISYEPVDTSSGLPFPSLTICTNSRNSSFVVKALNCSVHLIQNMSGCNDFLEENCLDIVSSITSPCSRNCLVFDLSKYNAFTVF